MTMIEKIAGCLTEIAQKITKQFLINNCVLALFHPDTGNGFNTCYLSGKEGMDWIDFHENSSTALYEAIGQFDAEYEADKVIIFDYKDVEFSIAFYGDSEPINNQEILDLIKKEIFEIMSQEE